MNSSTEYPFKPKLFPVITGFEAEKIIEFVEKGRKEIPINLSLGKSDDIIAMKEDDHLYFTWQYEDMKKMVVISINSLMRLLKRPERVYAISSDGSFIHIAKASENSYYQLIAVNPKSAPTIEINGIRMHRTKDVLPIIDAKIKVSLLKIRPGHDVLDICTGLGYTAIWASRFGGDIISVEKDANVLEIAEYNPWSIELSQIRIILHDATTIIEKFSDESFDRIINDPPRFSVAGELYSESFFKELYRLLRPGGILYQYTGSPEEKYRGKSIVKGIGERLRSAGFIIKFSQKAQGFICIKPKKFRKSF